MLLTSKPQDSKLPPAEEPPVPDAPAVAADPSQPFSERRKPTFARDHFAVLIVFAIFCLFLAVYVLEIHWSGDVSVTTWIQSKMDQLIAAILMGLTGGAANAALAARRK